MFKVPAIKLSSPKPAFLQTKPKETNNITLPEDNNLPNFSGGERIVNDPKLCLSLLKPIKLSKPKQPASTKSPYKPLKFLPKDKNSLDILQYISGCPHFTHLTNYRPNHKRAKAYMRDLKDGKIGTLKYSKDINIADLQDQLKNDIYTARPFFCSLFGAPGSRKSTILQEAIVELGLNEMASAITVVCPRSTQLKDWVAAINPTEDHLVKTYETPFRQPVNRILIVEEFGQTPPGWIDALLRYRQNVDLVIFIGDPKQNVEYIRHPDALTRNLVSNIDVVVTSQEVAYLNDTWRLAPNQSNHLGIRCRVNRPDCKVTVIHSLPANLPILTPSDARVGKLADWGHSRVFTYTGAQGSDFKDEAGKHIPYVLELTSDCFSLSERAWFVAITRSPVGIQLFCPHKDIINLLKEHAARSGLPSLAALMHMLEETEFNSGFQPLRHLPAPLHLVLGHMDKFHIKPTLLAMRSRVALCPDAYPKSHYPNLQYELSKDTRLQRLTRHELSMFFETADLPFSVFGKSHTDAVSFDFRLSNGRWDAYGVAPNFKSGPTRPNPTDPDEEDS